MGDLFNCQLSDVKLMEAISDDEGDEHFFFSAAIASDIELRTEKPTMATILSSNFTILTSQSCKGSF